MPSSVIPAIFGVLLTANTKGVFAYFVSMAPRARSSSVNDRPHNPMSRRPARTALTLPLLPMPGIISTRIRGLFFRNASPRSRIDSIAPPVPEIRIVSAPALRDPDTSSIARTATAQPEIVFRRPVRDGLPSLASHPRRRGESGSRLGSQQLPHFLQHGDILRVARHVRDHPRLQPPAEQVEVPDHVHDLVTHRFVRKPEGG